MKVIPKDERIKLYKRSMQEVYNALTKVGNMVEANEAKTLYNDGKCLAKHAIWLAKSEAEKVEFTPISLNGNGVFGIAKQMHQANQGVIGKDCVLNDANELIFTDDDKMKSWVEHCDILFHLKFEWPSD